MAVITNSPPSVGKRFLVAYINRPFLHKLFRGAPSRPDGSWPRVWQSVYRFLKNNARIVIDAEEQQALTVDAISTLLGGSGNTEHVRFEPGITETIATSTDCIVDDPFSLFLLEHPDLDTRQMRAQTGLLFLQYADLETEWPRVFEDHIVDVDKEKNEFTWSRVARHGQPLNSLVIADKYAYQQFHDGSFEDNLGALLDDLLPSGPLDNDMELTLITDLSALWQKQNIAPRDVKETIDAHVSNIRPDLKTLITVGSYQSSGHKDRYIITNYGASSSNDSFSFFKDGKLNKDTMLVYLPAGDHGSSIISRRLARLLKDLIEPWTTGEGVNMVEGDFRNRLLDYQISLLRP